MDGHHTVIAPFSVNPSRDISRLQITGEPQEPNDQSFVGVETSCVSDRLQWRSLWACWPFLRGVANNEKVNEYP